MKESPLTLIARMANKCRELFRRAGHPGWALFAEMAKLREARRHVARSQSLDAHLAGVVV